MLATRAADGKAEKVVEYLLSNEGGNAAVNLFDNDGRTVRRFAGVAWGLRDVNLADSCWFFVQALMFAAERTSSSLVDIFLAHPEIDVAHQAKGGFTAAVLAAIHGAPDLARKLMQLQKKQESEAEERKKNQLEVIRKGKPAKKVKKKPEEPRIESIPLSTVAQPQTSHSHHLSTQAHPQPHRKTFRIISTSHFTQDAGTAIERKAARIKSAIHEAQSIMDIVVKDLGEGWERKGEIVSVEELSTMRRGESVGLEDVEIAVTFAF